MLLPPYVQFWIARFAFVLRLTEQGPSIKPEPIESVWPTSIGAWGALVGVAFLVGEKIYKLWRRGQDPIYSKIDGHAAHFDAEMKRIEQQVNETLSRFQNMEMERRGAFREAVTRDINGWAERIEENTRDLERFREAADAQARAFIKFEGESKMDRLNINARLSVVESEVRGLSAAQGQMELRLTKAINESEGRLAAIIQNAVNTRTPK